MKGYIEIDQELCKGCEICAFFCPKEAIEASYEKGILTLNVPKAEEVEPKRIEVKVS